MTRSLECPCIYIDFKGRHYATMGVSEPIGKESLKSMEEDNNTFRAYDNFCFEVTHTEIDDCKFKIVKKEGGSWYHDSRNENGFLVIYKNLYNGAGALAKPLELFLAELNIEIYLSSIKSKGMYPNLQEYVFEKVISGNKHNKSIDNVNSNEQYKNKKSNLFLKIRKIIKRYNQNN